MHQRDPQGGRPGANKLGGPAGPRRSNGPATNGRRLTPAPPASHRATPSPQTIAASPSQQTSPARPQSAPASHSQHRIARGGIAPPQQANRFATLEFADSASPLGSKSEDTPVPVPLIPLLESDRPDSKTAGHRIRFSRKNQYRTYTTTQPLHIPSTQEIARKAPKRGCLKKESSRGCSLWRPSTGDEEPTRFIARFGVTSFRSLVPTRNSALPPPDNKDADVATIGAAGPNGGQLFRVSGTLAGHPVRCLIDCGATNDFVSLSFVERHRLRERLLPTTRRVRGYDGQVSAAEGTLIESLGLSCPAAPDGVLADSTPRRPFLVAQLHNDDVIHGMPWLAELDVDIDFDRQKVRSPKAAGTAAFELPLLAPSAPLPSGASATLISDVTALYSDPDHEEPGRDFSLAELLSRWDHRDCIAELAAAYDDRGPKTPQPQRHRQPTVPGPSELTSMRDRLHKEFKDVFADSLPAGLPPGRGHELRIKLVDGARPPAQVPPRIKPKHEAFEGKWLEDMLAKGLISASQSQYAAPHFYVDKPETPVTGEYRAVTDYRRLNAITVKNKYPLPRADELFDRLAHAKYFTKIDLRTGFYQILIDEADRHKTAFRTSQGLYQYNVLPMGLCNSPSIFMQLMNDTFKEFLNKFVLVFLDDIIVYSNTAEEHEQHVRQALLRLRQQRLYAKASKSALCLHEVEFLGHMVGRNGLRTMEDKVQAIRDWPTPSNIAELRAFLGLAGYYRRFVRGFSETALPLTELTRNVIRRKLDLSWGTKEQLAFVELKRALQSTPVLILPDPSKEFVVHCDASGYAVGAVLQQDRGNGLQPVAFLSRKMVGAETRYPVHEQELLAIVTALTTWQHYLEGAAHPVRIRTDHKSLVHFQTQPMLSGRQTRWIETLSRFDFVIEYVKGKYNPAADALSRRGDHADAETPLDRPPQVVDPVVQSQTKPIFALNRILVEEDRGRLAEFNAIDAEVRRNGRQTELERKTRRAAANDAATKVVPREEVSPDRPAPNAQGARVEPTQRCAAENRAGGQCKCRTAKGRHCATHMRSLDGLRVARSSLVGAGMGLFAARDINRGDHIADYTGDELVLNHDGVGGPYALGLTRRSAIDAARTNTGYGRWANDPRGGNAGPNSEFVLNPARRTGRLRATRNIAKGDEILVSYGPAYWRAFGPNAKLVARPAAAPRQPRKEVIDLTEATVAPISTFSSDLADAFDKACREDAAYVRDMAARQRLTPRDDPEEKPTRDECIVRDGRLFDRTHGCLVVPNDNALKTMLIRECHDAATGGHWGRDKTIEQMKRRFYWSNMDKDIELYVQTCEQCQRNKPSQQRTPGLLMPIASPDSPGHTWTMDFIVNLPPCARTGNDCVIVFVCKLTKLKHFVACKTDVDAPTTARLFLSSVVRLHGMPERIISDRDPRFTAHFWRAFWGGLGTTLSMSTAYHPQTDGQTENANRALEIMLRSVVNFEQDDWEDHLPAAELATNNARNATTGLSPFYMFYGREPRLPLDLALAPLTAARASPSAADALARWRLALVRAQETTKTAQARQKKYADEHRRQVTFAVGDRVLLATANLKLVGEAKRARKFTERYIGPYRVKRVVNANAYELELPPTLKIHPTINISQLKEYHDGSAAFPTRPAPLTRPPPEVVNNDGSAEWVVERILDHRRYGRRKVLQYLILWQGYPAHEATWEPIENLNGALELVVTYNTRKKIQLNSVESDGLSYDSGPKSKSYAEAAARGLRPNCGPNAAA